MVFTVLGALAELERNIIRERVTAGLRRAKKEGKHLAGLESSLTATSSRATRPRQYGTHYCRSTRSHQIHCA